MPDSTCNHFEEKGESDNVFLLETLSHVLGELFTCVLPGNRQKCLDYPNEEMISALIKTPPEDIPKCSVFNKLP